MHPSPELLMKIKNNMKYKPVDQTRLLSNDQIEFDNEMNKILSLSLSDISNPSRLPNEEWHTYMLRSKFWNKYSDAKDKDPDILHYSKFKLHE